MSDTNTVIRNLGLRARKADQDGKEHLANRCVERVSNLLQTIQDTTERRRLNQIFSDARWFGE